MPVDADLELMRASMLLDSDPSAAARQAGAILADHPRNEAANLLLAAACRRLGDSAGAIDAIEALALAQPASALIQLELGRTLAAGSRNAEAMAAFERAVILDATFADAWHDLSAQRFLAGEKTSADAAYLAYSRLARNPPEIVDAYVAFNSNRMEAAESVVLRRLHAAPHDASAHFLLAAIAIRRGDDAAAEASLNQVLTLEPCGAAAREELAQLMIRQGRIDEALPLIERSLAVKPHNLELHVLKAEALRLANRHAEGLAIITELIAGHADNPDLWLIAGNQRRFIGHAGEAIAAYRRAIELRSGYGEAYWALSNLKTFHFTGEDIEGMRRRLADPASPESERKHLEFALGKALEDEGQFADSFAHYARGNALARAEFTYDANAATTYVRRSQTVFSLGFLADRKAWGNEAEDPIFIIGLPRSGSTLLEQILASHSSVEGTRELAEIPAMARELASRTRATPLKYPESLARLERSDIDALAARYLAKTRAFRPLGRARFVDKMLGNFLNVGLIHLMFPRAAIIDCRRDPMGCGFSCYKQLFNPGMNFAYDLTEIGLYTRDYVDLMSHVDNVLPGRVLRIRYEQLITDTEGEVCRMLEHCGLPFEAQCLRFHENRRVAQTISSEQVRLPIYSEAVDQWVHFKPWLDPLKAALGSMLR
jgi:tetratricopeptide (TPR) repeat protein